MRPTLLVIAAPTIDRVDGRPPRVGGPGLYAALAAGRLGCRVDVLGPLGLDDASRIHRAYEALEAGLLGPLVPGCSYTFNHAYTPAGRLSRILCRPPSLEAGLARAALRGNSYDGVILSPVGCEVGLELARLLPTWTPAGATVALDVQGLARCYGFIPWESLRGYDFIHASNDDTRQPRATGSPVLYTLGAGGALLIGPGGDIARLPDPPTLVEDPTGAGDTFTTLVLCLRLRGYTLEEAAAKASNLTPRILAEARQVLDM